MSDDRCHHCNGDPRHNDARDCEIDELRAALDQERADNAKLRAFAKDVLRNANDASPYLRQFLLGLLAEHGVTDDYGNPTALLSGRGEDTSAVIRKVLDDNRDILEALGDG